jgi:fibronectin-binding autotransporter adhesin
MQAIMQSIYTYPNRIRNQSLPASFSVRVRAGTPSAQGKTMTFQHAKPPALLAGALLLITGASVATSANASTCVWTGAMNAAWSNAGNWTGCAGNVPVNGDTLQFSEAASNKINNHDLVGLTGVAGLAFTGSTAGYSLSGNPLALGAAGLITSNTSGQNTIAMNLSLSATQSFSGSTASMILSGALNLGGQNLTISWPNVTGPAPWTVGGIVSGSGSIVVNGADALTGLVLSGSNTFAGAVSLNSGQTRLDNATALGVADGSVANGTSVGSGATLIIGNGVDVGNERLTLASGNGQFGNGLIQHLGVNSWTGPLQLTGAGTSFFNSVGAGDSLDLTGPISGTGGLNLGQDPTTVYQLGNTANDFSGNVLTRTAGAIIRLGNSEVIPDGSSVILNGLSTLDTNDFDETIASLSCTATDSVILPDGRTLTVGGDNTDRTCAAIFSDPGPSPSTGLKKIGSGILTLNGVSTYAKGISVVTGGIAIDGTFPSNSFFFVNSGASILGTGTAGIVYVQGLIHGGGITPGTLTVDQMEIHPAGTLDVRISSATVFDQVRSIRPKLTLDAAMIGPNLDIFLGYVPLAGTVFMLIDNTGVDPVDGYFKNFPEGSSLVVSGSTFVISYMGGDGNDVTLTAGTGGPTPTIAYNPNGGAVVTLSATGTGSIAALGVDFQPGTSASISNCDFGPISPAFPASAFTITNPTFASPNGSIAIACTGQAAIVSGLMTCVENIDGVVSTPRWPIDCPAALPAAAPTAALAAASVTLINGSGFIGVDVLTPGAAPGSLDLDCTIAAAGANFQINSGTTRTIAAAATIGSNAPAIGLSCTPQPTLQSTTLTCVQTASPGSNPNDLTATIDCPAIVAVTAAELPTLSELGKWLAIILLLGAALQQKRLRRY